jgi:hypothetical protein
MKSDEFHITEVGIEKTRIDRVYGRAFAFSDALIFKTGVVIPFGDKYASLGIILVCMSSELLRKSDT